MLTYLAAGITKQGSIDVAPIDRMGISMELKKFKYQNGAINFGELIKMPIPNRIPSLSQVDMRGTVTSIAVAITIAMESMNLKRPMTATQIVDLAETIIDSAAEDQISIEDVLIFFQKLTRGEYGLLYESLDIQKVMHLFGKFRDERWEEGVRIRDAKDIEYKNLGDSERQGRKMTALDEHLSQFTIKLQSIKDELKEAKNNKK